MSQTLQPIPNFLTQEFALEILVKLGGQATNAQIRAYLKANYSITKQQLSDLMQQYTRLRKNRMINSKWNGKRDGITYIVNSEIEK